MVFMHIAALLISKLRSTTYKANPTATTSPVNVARYNLRYSLLPDGVDPWQTLKTNTYSFYVQDEFQVTEKFKLTGGLRGDVFAYDKEDAENFYNPIVGALNFTDEKASTDYKVNTGAFPKTRVLLSPRIGFNYDLKGDKSLQLRGGSGIFVSRIPQVLVSNQLGNNGGTPRLSRRRVPLILSVLTLQIFLLLYNRKPATLDLSTLPLMLLMQQILT